MSLVALVCFGCCIFFHVNVKYKNQFLHVFKKFGRKLISDKTNKKNTVSLIRKSDYSKISMLWTFYSLAFGFHKIDYQCHYYQILILCRSWNLSWKIIRQSRDEGLKFSFCLHVAKSNCVIAYRLDPRVSALLNDSVMHKLS